MRSSPLYSPPPEIAQVEREAERRLANESKLQLDELKRVNKIWRKECEGLKDKVTEKNKESTLAKNEAHELTKRLSTVATHFGFDSTPALLDYLRSSPKPVPVQQLATDLAHGDARIRSLETELAESTASNTTLAAQLEAERKRRYATEDILREEQAAKAVSSSITDTLRTEVDSLRKQVETERHRTDGLAFLVKEKDDWRGRETRMDEEAVSLRVELALAKADVAGLSRELEDNRKTVTNSQPLGKNTTSNSPASTPRTRSKHASPSRSRAPKVEPSSGLSKSAAIVRLEALLESSRLENASLQAKSKKQRDAWRAYAEKYPIALDAMRTKEERRFKRRESRGVSSSAVGADETAERPPKRIRLDSPATEKPSLRADASTVDIENQQPGPSTLTTGLISRQLSPATSPRRERSSPLTSPRPPASRPISAVQQPRSSSLAPTLIGSSPPSKASTRRSSPAAKTAGDEAAVSRRVETSALLSLRSPIVGRSEPVKVERKPHPLGQQAFGPLDLIGAKSTADSTSSSVRRPSMEEAPKQQPNPFQPLARSSRQPLDDATQESSSTNRRSRQDQHDPETPARPVARLEAASRGSHSTPVAQMTPAMRDKLSASRRWLGKKDVVNGKATNLDPLDQEVPEGEPLNVPRRTPRAPVGVRPKSDTGPPSSSSKSIRAECSESGPASGSRISPRRPKSEPGHNDDPFQRSPTSLERDEEKRRAVRDPTAGMMPSEKSIFLKKQRNVPVSVTREMYAPFKGRGRYSSQMASPGGSNLRTINDDFQINKERNDGKDYAYDSVVRGKEARKQLHAKDCECCRGYYESVGPLAPLPQGPRWRSPEPKSDAEDDSRAGPSRQQTTETEQQRAKRKRDEEIDSHRQQISRHRNEWEGPATPPHYWDIGFPSTQKVNMINAAADKLDEEKRARIEAEARKADGRYQRRA